MITALLLAGALAALPAFSGQATAARAPSAGHELLVVRAGTGLDATLRSMRTGADAASRRLPLGLLEHTGRVLYAATSGGDGRSLIAAIDVASGRTLRWLRVDGTFSTRTGDYAAGQVFIYGPNGPTVQGSPVQLRPVLDRQPAAPSHTGAGSSARSGFPADGEQVLSALSFDGRWLALREADPTVSVTRLIVVDTAAMRVVADHTLAGSFGLDAVTSDGNLLYLIQALPSVGFSAYQVRAFEVRANQLDPHPVVAPGEKPGSMSGEAWTRVWSPDGSWLYTLYVQDSGHVFVHALHLAARQTRCIDFPDQADLPSQASSVPGLLDAIGRYTLTVSPDGRSLYAVNPLLGRMAVVRELPNGAARIVRLAQHAGSPQRPQDAAAIAADGSRIFVATNHGVWAIDARALVVHAAYLPGMSIGSVALSRDGRHLYALATSQRRVITVDSATGRPLGAMVADGGAWAIEGVGRSVD
jgi:hypothetical protein